MAPDAHRVTVASGPTLEAPDGAVLRDVLLRGGVVPYGLVTRFTNCGGRGRCGTCRITVVDGAEHLGSRTPHERRRLPEEGAVRLACQASVRGDVSVAT